MVFAGMSEITFLGGTEGIGGNKILVEAGDARFFLDHGQSFSFGERFFAGWLSPRESRTGLKDYLALKLIPPLKGLYSARVLEGTCLEHEPPAFDGVFISHVHYDHLAHLRFIDSDIPVHMGITTKRMLDSWECTSHGVNFGPHDYHVFKTGHLVNVGSCEIEPVHVDHSTPAAYGLIVHAPEGAIVYTGDLRLHGPMAHMTRDFIEKAKEAEPIAMICEGTRVAPVETRKGTSEHQVLVEAINTVKRARELVIVSFYNRDIDRIKTYHQVAVATGRQFVVSMKVAHLVKSLVDDPGITVPDPFSDPHMLVYKRNLKRFSKWQKEIMSSDGAIVDANYIHEHQQELILHLDFTKFNEIVDIQPNPGSIYINSMSEPFSEDDIEERVKDNWLQHFKLEKVQLHASGHCSMDEIFSIVNEINPEVVFPVHTEHPKLFMGNVTPEVKIPTAGEKFTA